VFSGFTLAIISAVSSRAAEPDPLSLMTRPRGHAVQVGAGHHHVVVVAAGPLGDHVDVGAGLRRVDPNVRGRAGLGERLTVGEAGAHHRDGGRGRGERPDDQSLTVGRVALVEDDDRLGAGGLGVGCLVREGAGATLDQRDVGGPAEVQPGEVGRFAATGRGPRWHQVDVDRDHWAGHVTRPRGW
jgi:hypothetical protein